MDARLEKLAANLAAAWRDYTMIPLPAAADAPASRAEAYAVQDRIAELVGERVVGWKVGAAIAAVQRLEGHDGAIPGRLFASRIFDSPATVRGDRFAGHKVECEYAFRFTRDLPANRAKFTPDSIAEVMNFHPAIELAGGRYLPGTGGRQPRTHDAVADNGSGGAFVFGPAIPNWRKAVDFDNLPIDPRIDGGAPLQMYTGELRRNPLEIAAETVNDLAARGVAFKAGDYLSTGSLSLPTPVSRGQSFVAKFGDLATLGVKLT